jgi:hypothetical protein
MIPTFLCGSSIIECQIHAEVGWSPLALHTSCVPKMQRDAVAKGGRISHEWTEQLPSWRLDAASVVADGVVIPTRNLRPMASQHVASISRFETRGGLGWQGIKGLEQHRMQRLAFSSGPFPLRFDHDPNNILSTIHENRTHRISQDKCHPPSPSAKRRCHSTSNLGRVKSSCRSTGSLSTPGYEPGWVGPNVIYLPRGLAWLCGPTGSGPWRTGDSEGLRTTPWGYRERLPGQVYSTMFHFRCLYLWLGWAEYAVMKEAEVIQKTQ